MTETKPIRSSRLIAEIVAEMRVGAEVLGRKSWVARQGCVEDQHGRSFLYTGATLLSAHIARCDPDTILALLDDWAARGVEIERLTKERDALSKSLGRRDREAARLEEREADRRAWDNSYNNQP